MILSPDRISIDTLIETWGIPYEIWLLSTIETGLSRSLIVIDNPDQYYWALSHKKEFVTEWGLFKYEELPEKYFIFSDTSQYIIQK